MSKAVPITVSEVSALALRAEQSGQPNLATALYDVLGRMDRTCGGDGYDADEDRDGAVARGITRGLRSDYGYPTELRGNILDYSIP